MTFISTFYLCLGDFQNIPFKTINATSYFLCVFLCTYYFFYCKKNAFIPTSLMSKGCWKQGHQQTEWADCDGENQLRQNKGSYLSNSESIKANNNTLKPKQTMEITPYE